MSLILVKYEVYGRKWRDPNSSDRAYAQPIKYASKASFQATKLRI